MGDGALGSCSIDGSNGGLTSIGFQNGSLGSFGIFFVGVSAAGHSHCKRSELRFV